MPSTATTTTTTTTSPAPMGCNRCDHGFWVNPRNAMDRRPCFTCNGGSAGRRSYRFRPYMAPVAVAAPVTIASESPMPSTVDTNGTLLACLPNGPRGKANWQAFAATYPAEAAWLANGWTAGNDFARSLIAGCARYGGLTPRQLAAVQRNLPAAVVDMPAADTLSPDTAAVNAARSSVRPPLPVPAVTIDAGPLRTALDAAAASGLRKVRLTLGDLEFRRGFNGRVRNTEGQILVYARTGGGFSYVGKIAADGRWLAGFAIVGVPADLVDRIQAACTDPRAAASAHGHDTGYCACCRRLLTDPPSVMAGIGPVCIRRFNWGF